MSIEINACDATEFAIEVMRHECEAISRTPGLLDQQFPHAVDIPSGCRGNANVSGVGKSGLIGQKLNATMASTGTVSHFMYAIEAMHGDVGRVLPGDVAFLLNDSGSTDEVVSLGAVLKQDEVLIVSVSCHNKLSSTALSVGHVQEACPFNLAPTASTAAMLALGDAVAFAVSRGRSFSTADFTNVIRQECQT